MSSSLLRRALALLFLWWILSEGLPESAGLGAVAVAAALAASHYLLPPGSQTLRLGPCIRFLLYFVANSVRGGLQVAGLALRGPAALRPAMLEVELTLPEGPPALLLVNALGLMPGTLSVRLQGRRLRLHSLDARQPIERDIRALEARIGPIFGGAP